jgi:hypothetical protein
VDGDAQTGAAFGASVGSPAQASVVLVMRYWAGLVMTWSKKMPQF